jgi:hypothetical protein
MSRNIVIRIVRDHIGLKLIIDPNRIEYDADGAYARLSPLEESYVAQDIAAAHAARVFKDPEAWKG